MRMDPKVIQTIGVKKFNTPFIRDRAKFLNVKGREESITGIQRIEMEIQ